MKFLGFLAIGGLNTLFGYAAFAVTLLVGLRPELAVVVANVAGILFNFTSHGTLFGSRARHRFPRYVLAYGVLLAANIVLLKGLMAIHIHPLIGQGMAVVVLAPIGFVLMRRFVFSGIPQ